MIHRIHRFVYPDIKWRSLAAWGRNLSSGITVGLVVGVNWRCMALGLQWWDRGFCIHVGPLNVGYGWIERADT